MRRAAKLLSTNISGVTVVVDKVHSVPLYRSRPNVCPLLYERRAIPSTPLRARPGARSLRQLRRPTRHGHRSAARRARPPGSSAGVARPAPRWASLCAPPPRSRRRGDGAATGRGPPGFKMHLLLAPRHPATASPSTAGARGRGAGAGGRFEISILECYFHPVQPPLDAVAKPSGMEGATTKGHIEAGMALPHWLDEDLI